MTGKSKLLSQSKWYLINPKSETVESRKRSNGIRSNVERSSDKVPVFCMFLQDFDAKMMKNQAKTIIFELILQRWSTQKCWSW